VKTVLASLTNRIFLASALLAVLVTGVSVAVVNAIVSSEAEQELQRGLEEASSLVEQYQRLTLSHLSSQARLVADLPKFKAAAALDHPPTVQPLAEDYRRQIEATLVVVTNPRGGILGRSGMDASTAEALVRTPEVRATLGGGEQRFFWPTGEGLLQVVTVPVWIGPQVPELLGTLSAGVVLDQALAIEFRRLTNSEVAFVAGGRVRASTLPRSGDSDLESWLQADPTRHLTLGSQEYVGRARLLDSSPGTAVTPIASAGHPGPTVVVLRSRTERLRFLRTLHLALAATAGMAILLATGLAYTVARTITRPIRAITAAMREMASTGTLTPDLPAAPSSSWQDEDARVLATTFGSMTGSIARFQREMAQRERLTSLGRLSTVIAHEVRNPLMIVKTALRTLRREPSGERAAAAIADIDEEVARLNRLVNDVLDFARPIRFDLAPARLGDIVRGAAAAASGDGTAPPCEIACEDADLVTDAERLRAALINVVTNARQAVLGRADWPEGTTLPPVQIEARPLPADRVRITVTDRGAGMNADQRARMFDPFFTTKPAGTGVGLAITRHIVEGLGGSISVSSDTRDGTRVTIELPRASQASTPPATRVS
jgi:signal transduction histidine kinase